jgi:hypothetical protein
MIYAAVRSGRLAEPFTAADVREACPGRPSSSYAVLLAKHRVGNPGSHPELFQRVAIGRYRTLPNLRKCWLRRALKFPGGKNIS